MSKILEEWQKAMTHRSQDTTTVFLGDSTSSCAPYNGNFGSPYINNPHSYPSLEYAQPVYMPCLICGCAVANHELHEKWHDFVQVEANRRARAELQEMIEEVIELSAP